MTATSTPLNGLEQTPLFPVPLSPHIINVASQGPVLQPAPETGHEDVLSLNVTRGCFHRCAFCAVRAAPNYPGDNVLALYGNTAERLAADLAGRSQLPRAVFVSPTMDPFPPQGEVQDATAAVVRVLGDHHVEAWLMTRGLIRPPALEVLTAFRDFVKVTVPFTTMNRELQRTLEPWTAPPRLRLRQIADLRRCGISVQVTLEPLIPDVTDTTANLEPLLARLACVGVRHVTAGYLFLRDAVLDNLVKALGDAAGKQLHGAFANGPWLTPAGQAAARFLPRSHRQRGYANLMALAARQGITVSISRLSNPDFGTQPNAARQATSRRLLPLFLQGRKAVPPIASN